MERHESESLPNLYTEEDLSHIGLLIGTDSYLYHLAKAQSPYFIPELEKFLTSPRLMTAAFQSQREVRVDSVELSVQPLDENHEAILDAESFYINPNVVRGGLKLEASIAHLFGLYERMTGLKFDFDSLQ